MPKLKSNHKSLFRTINIIGALFAITYGFYILLGGEGINFLPVFG